MSLNENIEQDIQNAAAQTSTTENKSSESNKMTTEKASQKVIRRNTMRLFLERLRKLELHQADAIILAMNIGREKRPLEKLSKDEVRALNAYLCSGYVKHCGDDHDKSFTTLMKHRKNQVKKLLDIIAEGIPTNQVIDASYVLNELAYDPEQTERCLQAWTVTDKSNNA